MNKIIPVLTALFLLSAFPLQAQEPDYSKDYILRLPRWEESSKDYETKFFPYEVRLSKIDNKRFRIIPLLENIRWVQALKKPGVEGLIGEILTNDKVKRSGVMGYGIIFFKAELNGGFIKKRGIKGKRCCAHGYGQLPDTLCLQIRMGT